MVLAAIYSYYAFGLGSGALPSALQPYQWVLSDYQQLHQGVAALVLLLSLGTVVLSKRS